MGSNADALKCLGGAKPGSASGGDCRRAHFWFASRHSSALAFGFISNCICFSRVSIEVIKLFDAFDRADDYRVGQSDVTSVEFNFNNDDARS